MFSLLIISIGVTCVILSVMIFNDKIKLLRNGIRIEGEVVDFEHTTNTLVTEEKELLYITIYNPVIRFKGEDGNIRRITYDNSKTNKFYRIGDKVNLIYLRGDIKNIEINEAREMMTIIIKLIFIGVAFIIAGIFFNA